MRNHTLNLYKIANLSDLNFSYKLVQFELPFVEGKEDLHNKQLLKIAQHVSSLTGGPSALVKKDGRFYVAIPSNRFLPDSKVDVIALTVTLATLSEVYAINSARITPDNIEIVKKFLDFEIRKLLSQNPQLWKLNTGQFFLKKPIYTNEHSSIEIYGGFKYKLVIQPDGYYYICVDITFKYIDKYCLSQYVDHKNVALTGPRFRGCRALYLNGDDWYTIEIEGFGKKIQDHEFPYEGQTQNVYDYIRNKNVRHRIDVITKLRPDDLTLLYKYPGRTMEPHNGACSLAKILYNTNAPEVRDLHRQSIKDPYRRFDQINRNITHFFSKLTFNQKPIIITTRPVVEKIHQFQPPALKFNNNRLLQVGSVSQGGNTDIRDYGFERKQYILDNGVLTQTLFDEQLLIVPETLDKGLVESFKKNAEYQIKKLASAFTGFRIVRYKTKEGQSATHQIHEIALTLQQQNAVNGFALFILPDTAADSKRRIKTFHDCLKSKFYPDLKVQCASASKIQSYFQAFANPQVSGMKEYRVPEDKKPKFRSYLFNLVMEHLIINRKWPFALAQNLHYDIYIGVDVHERYAGFTFFFKNGEHIFFFPEEVPKKNKSQRAEKLKSNLLYKMIYEKLKSLIPLYAPNPNGIIIVRDGRSFGEEEKALQNVITSLTKDTLIDDSLQSGVIDLHKQSAVPLRIALQTNGNNGLENPAAGTYKLFSDIEGFLFNTGYPFQIPGSAKPLHLSLKAGNVNFLKVMEDLFGQSMLAFSAPDRSNALPITIKLIDTLLDPLTTTTDIEEDEKEFEEMTIIN